MIQKLCNVTSSTLNNPNNYIVVLLTQATEVFKSHTLTHHDTLPPLFIKPMTSFPPGNGWDCFKVLCNKYYGYYTCILLYIFV